MARKIFLFLIWTICVLCVGGWVGCSHVYVCVFVKGISVRLSDQKNGYLRNNPPATIKAKLWPQKEGVVGVEGSPPVLQEHIPGLWARETGRRGRESERRLCPTRRMEPRICSECTFHWNFKLNFTEISEQKHFKVCFDFVSKLGKFPLDFLRFQSPWNWNFNLKFQLKISTWNFSTMRINSPSDFAFRCCCRCCLPSPGSRKALHQHCLQPRNRLPAAMLTFNRLTTFDINIQW